MRPSCPPVDPLPSRDPTGFNGIGGPEPGRPRCRSQSRIGALWGGVEPDRPQGAPEAVILVREAREGFGTTS
jgi:hypothetical protein